MIWIWVNSEQVEENRNKGLVEERIFDDIQRLFFISVGKNKNKAMWLFVIVLMVDMDVLGEKRRISGKKNKK